MKKLLIGAATSLAVATGASAADLSPSPMFTKAPMSTMSWTGFYFGGHIGDGWVNETATFLGTTAPFLLNPVGTTIGTNRNGFLGGFQAGYDYQVNNWVIGIGGDLSLTNANATTVVPATLVAGATSTTQVTTNWYATLTGRIGYAWGNWLLYGKGGAAWTNETAGATSTAFGTTVTFNNITDTRSGWTVGAGLEWAVWHRWSVFAEYDYLGFGNKNYTFVSPAASNTVSDSLNISELKVGVNFRF